MTRKELVEYVISAVALPAWLVYQGARQRDGALRFYFERIDGRCPEKRIGWVTVESHASLRDRGVIRSEIESLVANMSETEAA